MPATLALKAQLLRLFGQNRAAIALMQQAVAASPDNAKLRLLHGHLLREIGEQEQAIEAYRQALALRPGMGEAYWSLANLKTLRFSDAELDVPCSSSWPAARRRARAASASSLRSARRSRMRASTRSPSSTMRTATPCTGRPCFTTARCCTRWSQRSKNCLCAGVLRGALRLGQRADRSDLYCRHAALGLDAARADSRQPLTGRRHARTAGTSRRSCRT